MQRLIITILSSLLILCAIPQTHATVNDLEFTNQLIKAEELFYRGNANESFLILDDLIANPDAKKYELLTLRAYDLAIQFGLSCMNIERVGKYLERLTKETLELNKINSYYRAMIILSDHDF